MKLKEGIVNSEEARAGVKSCEASVRESSELVEDSRKTFNEAQEATGRVVKVLEELEGDVADLNRQIQELQTKRDEEVECISQTIGELEGARASEQQASNELEELRRLEEDGRSRLEESRQTVKDKQRGIQVVESEMERARETMMQEKVSFADITQAIQQISGGSSQRDEGGDGLLF
jgi:chromosome segregation ATPase